MASGASMFLSLLILIHRSHAQMEVRVQIFADNTCTGTATADHQVPFSFGEYLSLKLYSPGGYYEYL